MDLWKITSKSISSLCSINKQQYPSFSIFNFLLQLQISFVLQIITICVLLLPTPFTFQWHEGISVVLIHLCSVFHYLVRLNFFIPSYCTLGLSFHLSRCSLAKLQMREVVWTNRDASHPEKAEVGFDRACGSILGMRAALPTS